MRFKPKNKTPEQILQEFGFSSAKTSRGFELQLHNPNRKTPLTKEELHIPRNRYHAFIEDGERNIHYDMPKGAKNHKAKSFGSRIFKIIYLFELADEGIDYKSRNFYKNQILKRRSLLNKFEI